MRAEEVLATAPEADGTPMPHLELMAGEAPLLSIRGAGAAYGRQTVLEDVSFDVAAGECVALVGASGSGKTTVSRCVVGLHELAAGEIVFDNRPLTGRARGRTADERRRVQYIFQSPYNSLNPRRTIGDSVAAPARVFYDSRGAEMRRRVGEALERVSLSPDVARRFPGELSGGERQRAAIARAMICQPDVLVCDEITSALDVSVQASIVGVLQRLQAEEGLSLLFVTHDLALVRSIAHRVVILNRGRVVEQGAVEAVLDAPVDDYTRQLITDTPTMSGVSARIT